MPSVYFSRGLFLSIFFNKNLKKIDDKAVSSAIGVILMVAVTILLVAATAFLAFEFNGRNENGPTASVQVSNNADTQGIYDIKIVHSGGDRIRAGDWKISIVKVPDPPEFVTASTDFQVGDQIVTTNLTNSGTVNVTNRSINVIGAIANFTPDTKYEIKIIVYPFKTETIDKVVEVR